MGLGELDRNIVDLLSDLVAIESVNPFYSEQGSGETEVARFVEARCRRAGLPVTRQTVLPGRDNLLIELAVPGAEATLLLEAHMDTVALEPMDGRALKPEIRDGRLHGRGACDDKGSLAAMLVALETLAARRSELRVNVLLLSAVDEEYKFRGVLAFIAGQRRIGGSSNGRPSIAGAVVGEPTSLRVVVAHKGVVRCRISTVGRAAHGSEPHEGINAIDQMAEVLLALRGLHAELQQRPQPLVGCPTLNVGRIVGGIGVNIVPDRCTIEVERRIVGGEEHDGALAEIDARLAELRARNPLLRVEREAPFVTTPTLATPPDADIVAAVRQACRDVGRNDEPTGVAYGSDASKLWTYGRIPSVVLGPGSIRQAHTAEEYVPIDELSQAAEIYVRTALNWPRAARRPRTDGPQGSAVPESA